MFCSQCGSALPDGAAFCPKCGARVIAPVEPAPEPEVAPVVEIVEEAAAPVVEAVEEAVAPVVETVEETVAPVVEEAAEAIEDLPEAAEAAAENAVDDVEAALARLKAEMAAAGELPAEMVTPAVEEAAEAIAEAAEPVAEPVAEAVEPVAEAVAEPVVEPVAEPIVEAVAESVVEPVAEPAPAVAPVIPIATSDEPAAYVKAASPAQTTINTIYNEPTTISAPVSPVEPAPAPAPEPVQPAYTAPVPEPVQPAYTAPAQQAYVPPAQPAYTAPQPQASYAPPAPVSQSSAGYSYQPAAAAPAAAQAKKSSPVAKIAIAAVIIALLGVGIWAIFGRGGNSGGGSNGGGTPIVNPTADGYDMLDSKGNPTLYTIMEGDGSDIVSTIEGVGFEWEQSNIWWVSSDGNDAFYVCGPADYEYSRSEISDLDVNGEGDPCVFVIVVDDRDYASGEDAFEKLCNVEVLDTEWLDSDLGLAVVQSPSGTMDFVLVNYNDEIGLYVLSIFNEEAAQAGVVDEYIDCGSGSVAECWEEFTGRSV